MNCTDLEHANRILKEQQREFPGSKFAIYENEIGHFAVLTVNESLLPYWNGYAKTGHGNFKLTDEGKRIQLEINKVVNK